MIKKLKGLKQLILLGIIIKNGSLQLNILLLVLI